VQVINLKSEYHIGKKLPGRPISQILINKAVLWDRSNHIGFSGLPLEPFWVDNLPSEGWLFS
jgi:hypothetical protein